MGTSQGPGAILYKNALIPVKEWGITSCNVAKWPCPLVLSLVAWVGDLSVTSHVLCTIPVERIVEISGTHVLKN